MLAGGVGRCVRSARSLRGAFHTGPGSSAASSPYHHPPATSRGTVLPPHTDRDVPLIILIGGATGVGKSTVADGLARKLGTPRVVTTDAVREVLRGVVSRDAHPELHCSTFEAGDLPAFGGAADPVIAGLLAQVRLVAAGMASLVSRALVEAVDIIVEGVHVVPGAHHLPDDIEATVVPLIITVDDAETHRSFLEARATSDRPPDRYLRNLDRIRRIQDEIIQRAHEHGVPQVSSRTPEQAVADALSVVESHDPMRS